MIEAQPNAPANSWGIRLRLFAGAPDQIIVVAHGASSWYIAIFCMRFSRA
jgi:hypothetical protein